MNKLIASVALGLVTVATSAAICGAAFADDRSEKTLKVLLHLSNRITVLESAMPQNAKHIAEVDWAQHQGLLAADRKLTNLATGEGKLATRIAELERKVAGMQKQITVLHAKKADK
ncbi:MAG: hypothetical protein EKK48_12120 [Candidatus Melainabacteria bacterium]|nr:MAG: hypothetical protein EKK48_12120 [Candidatus Melainabacteria bacterium]